MRCKKMTGLQMSALLHEKNHNMLDQESTNIKFRTLMILNVLSGQGDLIFKNSQWTLWNFLVKPEPLECANWERGRHSGNPCLPHGSRDGNQLSLVWEKLPSSFYLDLSKSSLEYIVSLVSFLSPVAGVTSVPLIWMWVGGKDNKERKVIPPVLGETHLIIKSL